MPWHSQMKLLADWTICFRLSNQVTLSRPVRSTLAKSLSKLNPAESIARLKEAGRKVREHLQRPTLERHYDPDPLFHDSESEAPDMSTQTRSPVLVASPRTSLSRDAGSANVPSRQSEDLGNNSDDPLTGSEAESQLPPICENVMLEAPDPLYRRHVSFSHSRVASQPTQESQSADHPPVSPFDGAFSATVATTADVGPGVFSNQPILGQAELPNQAEGRRASAERPWVPSRLSNSSQMPLTGLSTDWQSPQNGLSNRGQVLQNGLSSERQLPLSRLSNRSHPPAVDPSSQLQLPQSHFSDGGHFLQNGLASDRQLPASGLSNSSQVPGIELSSQPQLPPNSLSSEGQTLQNGLSSQRVPLNNMSSNRQLPPNGMSSERQLPPSGLPATAQLPARGISNGVQPPKNAVAAAEQLSAGLRQRPLDQPSPLRPVDRTYSSDKQLKTDRSADRRFSSDRQPGAGSLSPTPILGGVSSEQAMFPEQSTGSRRFSRQKTGMCWACWVHQFVSVGFDTTAECAAYHCHLVLLLTALCMIRHIIIWLVQQPGTCNLSRLRALSPAWHRQNIMYCLVLDTLW